jgi:hypothetical protein
MNTPNIALYAGGRLRPQDIMKEMDFMRTDGFSTIILNMFHIGNPAVKAGTQLADIIFNADDPIVIREGKYIAAPDWPGHIAELKGSGSKVTQLYACFGGAPPWVRDFETIKKIYNDNNNSFSGTQLEKNCEVFRATFPAIDGIDMDCEETYDLPSFIDLQQDADRHRFSHHVLSLQKDGFLDHGARPNRKGLSACREMVESAML